MCAITRCWLFRPSPPLSLKVTPSSNPSLFTSAPRWCAFCVLSFWWSNFGKSCPVTQYYRNQNFLSISSLGSPTFMLSFNAVLSRTFSFSVTPLSCTTCTLLKHAAKQAHFQEKYNTCLRGAQRLNNAVCWGYFIVHLTDRSVKYGSLLLYKSSEDSGSPKICINYCYVFIYNVVHSSFVLFDIGNE